MNDLFVIKNPYLDECSNYLKWWDHPNHPDYRFSNCRKYAWHIPTTSEGETIAKIIPNGKFISIASGTGYLEWFYSQFDLDFVAFDVKPHNNYFANGNWFDVQKGSFGKIKIHPDRNLFMSWIEYGSALGELALLRFLQSSKAEYVVLLSEGRGGCVGNNGMFDVLDNHFQEIELEECYSENWYGIYSNLSIYRRK